MMNRKGWFEKPWPLLLLRGYLGVESAFEGGRKEY